MHVCGVCVCMNVCTLNIQYTCEGQRTNRYHSVLMRKAGNLTKTGLASRCFDRILERNSLKGKKKYWLMVSGAGACDGGTHHGGCTWQRRPLTSVVSGKGEIGEREERVPMPSQGHSTNDLIAESLMFLPSSRSCCRPRTKHGTHQTGVRG